MVRRKTQKGAGNAIRNESYSDALKRDYVFFYHKLKGLNVPKEKRFIEPELEEQVKRVLLNAKQQGMEQDEIVRTIFQADPVQFQQELSDWEEYKPSGFLDEGTPYARRAFPIAKSLDRFIGTIQASPKTLQYRSDFMVHICSTNNTEEFVTSLSDKFCVTVLTPEMRTQYEDNKGSAYPVSYIVVKPEFFPPRVTAGGGPITLNAQRIPVISFLLDAFQQDGVLEFEPTLYKTLQKEAPELLRLSFQEPVLILTPGLLKDASLTNGKYIVVDPTKFPRKRNVVNLKSFPGASLVKQIFTGEQVLFMDPITMYKVRSDYPFLWVSNFGDAHQSLFQKLSPHEKLVFAFLQYTKVQELTAYFLVANASNTEESATQKFTASLLTASQLVFQPQDSSLYELEENFQAEDEENLRQMVNLQQTVFGSVKVRTPEDVHLFLQKLDPTVPQKPVLRIKPVYPRDTMNQRAVLLKAYQNALKASVSTSRIPNFLRTRKAKNTNRETYKQRIRNAKARLLNFNREHGLPFSKGAEQYNL